MSVTTVRSMPIGSDTMKCEVCGEDTDFFTDTYDPLSKSRVVICLCEKHEGILFRKIIAGLGRMKLDYDFRRKVV